MRVPLLRIGGGLVAALLALGVTTGPAATYEPDPVGPVGWDPDGPVLAVTSAGNRVFVGGGFTGGVAALDADTGDLLWRGHADGVVRALAVTADGTHVIAGGGFTAVDGAEHRRLALLQVGDGDAEAGWRASAGGMVRDIVVRGDTAYFGGQFSRHDGVTQRVWEPSPSTRVGRSSRSTRPRTVRSTPCRPTAGGSSSAATSPPWTTSRGPSSPP